MFKRLGCLTDLATPFSEISQWTFSRNDIASLARPWLRVIRHFDNWQIRLGVEAVEEYIARRGIGDPKRIDELLRRLCEAPFLCCPEDVECKACPSQQRRELCLQCEFPLCFTCRLRLCRTDQSSHVTFSLPSHSAPETPRNFPRASGISW